MRASSVMPTVAAAVGVVAAVIPDQDRSVHRQPPQPPQPGRGLREAPTDAPPAQTYLTCLLELITPRTLIAVQNGRYSRAGRRSALITDRDRAACLACGRIDSGRPGACQSGAWRADHRLVDVCRPGRWGRRAGPSFAEAYGSGVSWT